MFFEKYLNQTYLTILYDEYDNDYLKTIDEENFAKVYNLLKDNNYYFVDDLVVNYLELFEIDVKYVAKALEIIGKDNNFNYTNTIGKKMTIMNKIVELAQKLEEQELDI